MIAIRLGSCEIVVNPSLKSDRDRRRVTALQGEVAVLIKWRTWRSLTRTVRQRNPMRARARCACSRLGGRRPETRYIWFVIFRQRVAAIRYGVPHLKSSGP